METGAILVDLLKGRTSGYWVRHEPPIFDSIDLVGSWKKNRNLGFTLTLFASLVRAGIP